MQYENAVWSLESSRSPSLIVGVYVDHNNAHDPF